MILPNLACWSIRRIILKDLICDCKRLIRGNQLDFFCLLETKPNSNYSFVDLINKMLSFFSMKKVTIILISPLGGISTCSENLMHCLFIY